MQLMKITSEKVGIGREKAVKEHTIFQKLNVRFSADNLVERTGAMIGIEPNINPFQPFYFFFEILANRLGHCSKGILLKS